MRANSRMKPSLDFRLSLSIMVFSYLFVFVYNYVIIPCFFEKIQEKSAHNEIGAFYAHMVLTHERRFAR